VKRATIPAIAETAILTKAELSEALQISEDLLEALIGDGTIPCVRLRRTVPRFVYGQVVRRLERLAEAEQGEPKLRAM
jgi:predicted site-specific integrase-resolvase